MTIPPFQPRRRLEFCIVSHHLLLLLLLGSKLVFRLTSSKLWPHWHSFHFLLNYLGRVPALLETPEYNSRCSSSLRCGRLLTFELLHDGCKWSKAQLSFYQWQKIKTLSRPCTYFLFQSWFVICLTVCDRLEMQLGHVILVSFSAASLHI